MELYDFKILSFKEQLAVTFDKGYYLGGLIESPDDVNFTGYNLYKLNNFYVEISLDTKTNEYKDIRSFKAIHNLDPYLEEVDIAKLLNS